MARPWERPKARAKARARARASNGLMCVKEGRPNVMLKENSERKIAAPGTWFTISDISEPCLHPSPWSSCIII